MKTKQTRNATIEQIGWQSLLPGMVWMHDLIGREIERIQKILTGSDEEESTTLLELETATSSQAATGSQTATANGRAATGSQTAKRGRWTAEQKFAQAERMRQRWKQGDLGSAKGSPVPDSISGMITRVALARELGVSVDALGVYGKSKGIPHKIVLNPSGGKQVAVYVDAAAAKIRKLRGAPPVARPSGSIEPDHSEPDRSAIQESRSEIQKRANHPRNPDHPNHAAYIQKQRDAAARRKAAA